MNHDTKIFLPKHIYCMISLTIQVFDTPCRGPDRFTKRRKLVSLGRLEVVVGQELGAMSLARVDIYLPGLLLPEVVVWPEGILQLVS